MPQAENVVATFVPPEAVDVDRTGRSVRFDTLRVFDNFGAELVAAVVHLRT
jgi:hypothetical protein